MLPVILAGAESVVEGTTIVEGAGASAGASKIAESGIKHAKKNPRGHVVSFTERYNQAIAQGKRKPNGNILEDVVDGAKDLIGLHSKDEKETKVEALPEDTQEKLGEDVKQEEGEEKKPSLIKKIDKAKTFDNIKDSFGGNFSNFPTPAGIGGLLVVIIFILFAISTIMKDESGHPLTRLGLFWRTILGRTAIYDVYNPEPGGIVVDSPSSFSDRLAPTGTTGLTGSTSSLVSAGYSIAPTQSFSVNNIQAIQSWANGLSGSIGGMFQ
jgi:hypothetical protein